MTQKMNLDFRPASYWDADGLLMAAAANIKGSVRKSAAIEALRSGRLEDLQEFLLQESLSDRTRKLVGSMHPMFMGGEYLPDHLSGEVEIARVTLASVTRDVEVVRARPEAGRIRYRAVDEYYDQYDTTIKIEIEESESPLTMRQLIHVIDTASYYGEYSGMVFGLLHFNTVTCGGDWCDYEHFFEVTSEFYPELGRYYEERLAAWFKKKWDEVHAHWEGE